ncbi:MAG: TlpA family protein disulfide reductase [Candidatus Nitrosotenuis sp.]
MKKPKKLIGGGIAAASIIAIVFAAGASHPSEKQATIIQEIDLPGPKIGSSAPDFTLNDPQNGLITKQSFAGKPLFIFYTTTWCTPCQIGAQNLARYDLENGDDTFNVLIVFVDDKETDDQFVAWNQKFGRDDWYVAKGIEMAKLYKVQQLDTKYVFDKNGIIQWKDIAPLTYGAIKPVMEPLLRA